MESGERVSGAAAGTAIQALAWCRRGRLHGLGRQTLLTGALREAVRAARDAEGGELARPEELQRLLERIHLRRQDVGVISHDGSVRRPERRGELRSADGRRTGAPMAMALK